MEAELKKVEVELEVGLKARWAELEAAKKVEAEAKKVEAEDKGQVEADDKGKEGYETELGTTSVVVQLHLDPLCSLEPMGSLSAIPAAGRW